MNKFSLSIYLNAYADQCPSNNPGMNNFKWERDLRSIFVNNPTNQANSLVPGQTIDFFNGQRTILQDATTEYSIALKPATTSTYILSWSGGTAPNFRTPRTTGADATTEVTATVNGPIVTFSAPAVSAVAASFTGQVTGMTTSVTITANNVGTLGNNIKLTGDGTSSVATLISNWNTANPSNQATLTSGDGTQIPALATIIQLSGGVNSATAFNLISGGVTVGDYVTIGSNFNVLNQGTFQIIAVTATSFTVQIPTGIGEGPILLGSGFANQIAIFSAAGVQINDVLDITGGFSLATQGSYTITAVYANSLEFSSLSPLPEESNILTQDITIYSNARQLIYIESDSAIDVIVNNVVVGSIEPFIIPNAAQPQLPPAIVPGVFMLKSTIWSLSVQNNGLNTANVYMAAIE